MVKKNQPLDHNHTQGAINLNVLFLVYIVVFGTLLLMVVVYDFPLLANYVNQLARIFIQLNWETDPGLAANYRVHLAPLPNLAMEMVVVPLAHILPLELAARLFVWLVLVSQLAGAALLHRALFKAWSWWPLLVMFFLFGATLRAGYVNFSFGVGFAMLATAAWIGLREGSWAARLVVGSLLSVALYFCHIFAVAAYFLLLGSYELVRFLKLPRETRSWWNLVTVAGLSGLQVIVPLGLFLANPLSGSEFVYNLGSLNRKLIMLFGPVATYNLLFDLATAAILFGGFVFLSVKRYLQVSHFMIPALGILCLLFAVSPGQLLNTGFVDSRFIQLAAVILAASIKVDIPSQTWKRIVGAGLALLIVARYAIIAANLAQSEKDVAEIRLAFAGIERGSKVLISYAMDRQRLEKTWRERPQRHLSFIRNADLQHVTAVAVIDKAAFVPHIHMHPGKLLIAPGENLADLHSKGYVATLPDLETSLKQPDALDAKLARIRDWPARFDYLAVLYPRQGQGVSGLGPVNPEPLYEGQLIDVYRIEKP